MSVEKFIIPTAELPKARREREPIYDNIIKSLEKREKGIFEIKIPDKKSKSVYSALRTRLNLNKMKIKMRKNRVFIEIL